MKKNAKNYFDLAIDYCKVQKMELHWKGFVKWLYISERLGEEIETKNLYYYGRSDIESSYGLLIILTTNAV